ncbi:adaptor protein MecA [Pontibacillus litoralis]|uniref:Adapter protein MecA n=1 Tax=Pontibacillus litoralis JSM 072002 TaxID=1385512 RepID=A0A0A5G9D0_9BACI|nr:adaptor protein MecA [Pontibacillus litoralis]KGX87720.1 adaptor protein [Pontibacillus litoralis JSM 072002]
MEIERINENTVKFYVTYMDIEDRGFDREEIWYNRERSEQLFWQMMDEVNGEEEFNIEGPLWIQVQAMDKGLEIVVTKAQLSKDGQKLELPTEDGKTIDMPVDEKLESMLENDLNINNESDEREQKVDEDDGEQNQTLSFVIRFQDLEDVIQLSHYFRKPNGVEDQLYHFNDAYYVYIDFTSELLSDEEKENILSQLLEFGHESPVSVYRLQEYGKSIITQDALCNIANYFPS